LAQTAEQLGLALVDKGVDELIGQQTHLRRERFHGPGPGQRVQQAASPLLLAVHH
jgi:hypothetical protein